MKDLFSLRVVLMWIFWVTGSSFAVANQVEQVHSIETIRQAWTARSEAVKTFQFTWTAREWEVAGWRSGASAPPGQQAHHRREVLPAEDVIHDILIELTVAGKCGRKTRSGPEWIPQAKKFIHRDSVEQWTSNEFGGYVSKVPNVVEASALITNETKTVEDAPASLPIQAIMFALRQPLVDDGNWIVTGHTGPVAGFECVLLEKRADSYSRKPADAEQLFRLWLAPELDYSLIRYSASTGVHILDELSVVEYEHNHGIPIPIQWTRKYFHRQGDHDIYKQVECKVSSYLINRDVMLPDFRSSVPFGTTLTDRTASSAMTPPAGSSNSELILALLGIPVLVLIVFRVASLRWRRQRRSMVTVTSSQETDR